MTAEPLSSTARQTSPGLARWWRRLDHPLGLTGIIVIAVVVRLLLAPHFGFYGDLRYFREWAGRLQERGLRHFYAPDYFADYPPGYLYVLAFLGKIQQSPGYQLLKLPILIGDLALAWCTALLAARLAPESVRRRLPIRPIVLVAVLFNPAVLGVGAVWGQVDSVPSSMVMGTLLLLLTGRRSVARDLSGMVLFAVALAIKPQAGFLAPVLAYILIRRYVVDTPAAQRLVGAARLVLITVVSGSIWAFSGVPFGLSPSGLVNFLRNSAKTYPVTSANAFNFWGLFGFFKRDSDNFWNGQFEVVKVFGVKANTFGTIIVGLGAIALLWAAHRAITRGCNQARTLIATAVATNLLAYTMLTRMHERYMFPVIACLGPLLMWRWFRAAYWTLSILFVLNLWYPFALYNGQWDASGRVGRVYGLTIQPWFRWFFGNIDAVDTGQKKLWSFLVVVVTVAFVGVYYRWLLRPQLPRVWARQMLAPGRSDSVPDRGRPVPPAPERAAARDATGNNEQTASEPDTELPPAPLARTAIAALHRVRTAIPLPGAEKPAPSGWLRHGPRSLVALACTFGLLALRGELRSARTLNDSTFHLQMIRWASGQLERGRLPLDGWFPDLTLGSSFFHHYQSLPYTVTAILGRILHMSVSSMYLWILYLLVSLWPISVYWGGRLMGWGRWAASAAALVSPLIVSIPSYGYEHGSYTFQGWGVYTQLWGMWLLPLTWGLMSRAIRLGRGYPLAALALALTIATHLMTGYLAVLCLPVLGLLTNKQFGARVRRTALLGAGGLLTAAWVLVPLLTDKKYSAQSTFYKGTLYNDSYGAKVILGWLFRGALYDGRHLPVITILAAVGFVVCALHLGQERARIVLGLWTLSLLLYFGRVTWKSMINVLPGSEDLQMHRFIIGVQMAGILLAGIGTVALARLVVQGATAVWDRYGSAGSPTPAAKNSIPSLVSAAAVVVLGAIALSPSWRNTWDYDRGGWAFIDQQRDYDRIDGPEVSALLQIANNRGDGRVYAGTRGNWGPSYKVGFVPVLHYTSHNDTDGVGFTFRTVQSLTTDIEASFDENNLSQYEMLNVRYIIAPTSRVPAVPHTVVQTLGGSTLYAIETTGYFQVVDRVGSISANRVDINDATAAFRGSDQASRSVYPGIAFDGDKPLPDTVTAATDSPPGTVINQSNQRADGIFEATVSAQRRSVVVLKATYDPGWRVTVDGESANTVMMAPSIVGVEVGPGQHTIRFSYRSYPHYPWLFLLGALALLSLGLWPRREQVLVYAQRAARRFRPRPGR